MVKTVTATASMVAAAATDVHVTDMDPAESPPLPKEPSSPAHGFFASVS